MLKTTLFFLTIALASYVSQATATPEQAIPVFRQPYGDADGSRIVGGETAKKGQFPHQAGITMNNQYFCGGSLISEIWILTAGHCVDGFTKFVITLGAHNIKDKNETGRITLSSSSGIRHENYNAYTIANDVGLIKLPEAVKLGDQINIIALPRKSDKSKDFTGTIARVSGWGKTSDAALTISPTLQFVDLNVITIEECREVFGSIIDTTKYCCSGVHRKSTCNGDSGGSLTVGTGKDLRNLGIVSFGSVKGCALEYPIGFTATPYFLDWISNYSGIPIQD